jgi:predicted outer membrane repeat protein
MRRITHRVLYGLALLGTLLALALLQMQVLTPRLVLAGTFTVTSVDDTSTSGTLRDAITQANANADASTITFNLPPDSAITLTDDLPTITADLTIDGSGASGLTIDGADTYTIFATGTTAGIDLSISNLILTNGSNTSGGAVAFLSAAQDGSSLLLDNVTITSSIAADDGGAVFVAENAVATIQDSTIGGAASDGNRADDEGGGIASFGTLTVTNSEVSHNSAGTGSVSNFTSKRGGGIFAALDVGSGPDTSGPLTLVSVQVTNNTSRARGGGVYSRASQLTITDSNIDDNAAQNTSLSDAGGIYIGFGNQPHTITGGTINRNTTEVTNGGGGGGIYLNEDETLTITGTEIDGNEALRNNSAGGGIYVTESDLTLDNTTVTNNQAELPGGGVYIGGTPSCVENPENPDNFHNLIIQNNSTISGNTAKRGGGIFTTSCDLLTITDSVIDGNTATEGSFGHGGGIYANWTTTIARSTISGNKSEQEDGGGIYFENDYDEPLTISESTFSGNSAGDDGGGIFNNTAPVTITNSTLITNTASNNGGGISNNNGTAIIINSTLITNTANSEGGGIYNNDIADIVNSTFSGNDAEAGGGISNNGGTADIVNSTLITNTASTIGGGIYNTGGTATLANTIVAASISGDDYAGDAPTMLGENIVEDSSVTGIGVNNTNPQLGPLADNGGPTLTLLPLEGSPAIDAGSDAVAVDAQGDPLTTDQRGFNRISGGTVDIGAVEIQTTNYGITLDPDSISEGDSGTTDATVTVTRSDATSVASTVDLALSGTATEGASNDYTFAFDGTSGASFDGTTLSFDANITEATFTLTVQDDALDENDETVSVTLSNATAPETATITPPDAVILTITDNDTADVSVSKSSLTVSEDGSDTYTVVLDSQPTAEVMISVASSDESEATAEPASLTFTTGDWDTAQTVTVTGVDDTEVDGEQTVTISHSASSADSAYDTLDAKEVTVTVTDDDSASGPGDPSDPTPPDAPIITSPATSDTPTPTISGTAEPSSTLRLTITLGIDSSVVYTTTVGADGSWSIDLGTTEPISGTFSGLEDGQYQITATATGAAGNTSDAATQTLTVDIPKPGDPAAPVVTSSTETNDPYPTISGTAEAGVTITLTIDLGGGASVTYTTTADGDGNWSIDLANDTPTDGALPAGGLSDGSYPVTVTATNETGNTSTQYTLTVQTGTPAAGTTLYLPLIAR